MVGKYVKGYNKGNCNLGKRIERGEIPIMYNKG